MVKCDVNGNYMLNLNFLHYGEKAGEKLMNRDETNDIIIALYDGAYGPTLIFIVNSRENLFRFKKLFSDLSKGEIEEISLFDRIEFKKSGFNDLILKSSPKRKFYSSKINISNNISNPTIIWSLSFDEWYTCEVLIDSLIESDHPGHQYLTHESDGILFEFTYLEHEPE
jgi:hypothetical protein